jgi:large subunit ribosomal protein L24
MQIKKYKKINLKVGDNVQIISGNHKTKTGKIKAIIKQTEQVVIENINIRFRHVKPSKRWDTGKIVQFEAPIHISNIKKIVNT